MKRQYFPLITAFFKEYSGLLYDPTIFLPPAFGFTLTVTVVTIFGVMAGKIRIDSERCKGCGLCVVVCPKKSIQISEDSNKNGYFPAEFTGTECTGCAMCAIICPEAVIEVSSDDEPTEIKEIDSKNKTLPRQQAKELKSG